MKKIDKYFWTKSNNDINYAYCYSFVYNSLHITHKNIVFNLRTFYKL